MSTSAKDLWPEAALEKIAMTITPYPVDDRYLNEEGWARFTKRVVKTPLAATVDKAELGNLLNAEWVDSAGTSWRIAPDPSATGALKCFAFGEVGGDSHYKESVTVFGHGAAAGALLNYTVYWEDKVDGAITRICDAFTGFEKGPK
jgi:hypothetical protein